MQISYLLQLAWKDAWRQKLSLFILASCCILGTAALLAITSLKDNISFSVEQNSKTILGADFIVSTRQAPDAKTIQFLNELDKKLETKLLRAEEVSFSSMVLFEKDKNTRLSQVVGVSGSYPLYGSLDVSPADASKFLNSSGNTILDNSLKVQHNLREGDVVSIGNAQFVIKGFIDQTTGSTEIRSAIAPRVFIPLQDVLKTELVKKGSIVKYSYYFRGHDTLEPKFVRDILDSAVVELNLSLETHEDRNERLKKNLNVAYYFFDIATLLSFLLGGMGVASGAYVYYQNKRPFLETLYYLGLNRRQALFVYGVQIISFGGMGVLLGIMVGILIQWSLPAALSSITPVPIPFFISGQSILFSLFNGLFSLVIFSGASYLLGRNGKRGPSLIFRYVAVISVILGSIYLGAYFISKNLMTSLIYLAACILIFTCITAIAHIIRKCAQKLSIYCTYYPLEQGIRNIYRPNNQTLTLLVAIGLSTFSILFIFTAEDLSIAKLNLLDQEQNANILLFDVQEDQLPGIKELMLSHQLPVMTEVPVVQMRITKINSVPVQDIRNNLSKKNSIPEWVLTREYRSSYKKTLEDTEQVVEGEFVGLWNDGFASKIPISVEQGMMEKLGLKINDTLAFSVQGVEVDTYISSIRKVNWQQLKPNFFMLFPSGALDGAPLNFILLSRYKSVEQNVAFQRELVSNFGNISAIDLELILKTLRNVSSQLRSALLFLTLLVVLSAGVILVGIVWSSRSVRIEENTLLRTLGAKASTIRGILYAEYGVLAFIGVFSGLVFALLGGMILSYYVLEMPLVLPWLKIFGICLSLGVTVAFGGIIGSFGTIRRPALQSFRMLEG